MILIDKLPLFIQQIIYDDTAAIYYVGIRFFFRSVM